jgi:alpha-glucosidase
MDGGEEVRARDRMFACHPSHGVAMTRTARILLPLLLVASLSARADRYAFLGDLVSHVRDARGVTFTATNNVLRLTVVDSATVRVQVGIAGRIADIPSYAVSLPASAPEWRLDDRDSAFVLTLPRGSVEITKRPLRLRMLDARGRELLADDPAFGHAWDGKEVHTWKRLTPDLRFYGLGEKTGDVDKRGASWTMWNSDIPGYTNDRDPIYVSIPFFLAVRGVGSAEGMRACGVFFDNTHRSVFNMGAASNRLFSFGAEDGEMNYYVFFGSAPADVVAQYTALTGRMPLPPAWALGYQQCRWNYYPEFEVRDLARNFRQRGIPADVLYLDIRYMDRYKVFTWDRAAFPDPARLMADLRRDGFRVVTIVDPGVKIETGYATHDEGVREGHFARHPDGTLYAGEVWPGWCHFPDFTRPATREWWGRNYGEMHRTGVSGFWNDMNEPAVWGREFPYLVEFEDGGAHSTIKKIHNVYGYLMAQASYEGMRREAPDARPFIVSRAGYAGQQKYSAIWTGDNVARWDDMAMGIRMCIGLGLSGVPFTGPDIGGFIDSPSGELFGRWMQVGVFTPFFRTHTVINTRDQEPWSFGEEVEQHVRTNIELRYRLLPYIYSAFREASVTGLPIMRPLWLAFADDARSYEPRWQHQYLFGSDILVAPVLHAGQNFQKLYFPPGLWIDTENGAVHEGAREQIIEAPWSKLPWFLRGGACVAMRPVQQYTGEKPLDTLILLAGGGASGRSMLYLDAGEGFAYEQGMFDEITFTLESSGGRTVLTPTSTHGLWARGIRTLVVHVYNVREAPRSVRLGDRVCTPTQDLLPASGSYRYDAAMRRLTVTSTFSALAPVQLHVE